MKDRVLQKYDLPFRHIFRFELVKEGDLGVISEELVLHNIDLCSYVVIKNTSLHYYSHNGGNGQTVSFVTMYLCLKLCNRAFLCVIVCKGLGWGKIRNQGNYRSRPGFPSVGENFYPTRKIQKARNPCDSKDSGHIQAKK